MVEKDDFNEFIEENYYKLGGIARTVCRANRIRYEEDYLHDCIIDLYNKWSKRKEVVCSITTYIYVSFRSKILNIIKYENRAKRKIPNLEYNEEILNSLNSDSFNTNLYIDLLMYIKDIVTPYEYKLIVDKYLNKLSYGDLSNREKVTFTAIKTKIHRIVKKIKSEFSGFEIRDVYSIYKYSSAKNNNKNIVNTNY